MRLVVDSSALLVLLLGEPERELFHGTLLANEPLISVVNLVESQLVARGRLGEQALEEIELFVTTYELEVAPVLAADLAEIRHAMLRYGKGRGEEPAVLNFGDLFAYALAKRLDLPLLFKGDDFTRTDVQAVLG
jgi:ribonuclease VapC